MNAAAPTLLLPSPLRLSVCCIRRTYCECYISVVLTLIQRHRWWFAGTTAAALLLRLFFVLKLPLIAGDTLVYGDIAKCLVNNHIFGIEKINGCQPTLIRLPGYPFFLAFSFLVAGVDRYFGAMLFQLLFDVLTCFLVADIARRAVGERAARTAFMLAAFCPFLMSYVATPLTECLEIFFIAAAIDCAMLAIEARRWRWWALCGFSCAGAILLRPDGGLILGCIGIPVLLQAWHVRRTPRSSNTPGAHELISGMLIVSLIALAPLLPWTIRNWRVFHVFQPLVTTHATDPGEIVSLGWERWFKTWLIDYSSVEDVGFQIPGYSVDVGDIPDRAYTSSAQRAQVHRLLDEYNAKLQMTPELDRQFGALADENIRLHPVRYYLLLPTARTLDMWLRPRNEILPLDSHFWKIWSDPYDSWCDIALGLLNLAYVSAAVAGAWKMRRKIKYLGLLLTYPIVRSLFLATTGASEDRYTLECFPFVFVLATAWLCWWQGRKHAGSHEAVTLDAAP